jgi:hypothetical protein
LQSRNPGQAVSSTQEHKRPGSDRLILAILLLVYLVASLLSFNPTLYTGGDNAHYIILAQSMLSGKGYRDIYKPGEPLHTLYPFGYPLLLVPPMALFGGSFIALKLLSLVLGAGSVLVAFLLLRGGNSRILLCSVVGLFALSPLLLEYSHWALSDVPFAFFSLLGLLLAKRSFGESGRISIFFWLALVCIAFAYFIRPVGIALILGLLLHLVLRKQYRKTLIAVVVLAALLVPWSARTAKAARGEGYIAPMVLKDPYDATSGTIGPVDLLGRVRANGETYFLVAFPQNIVTPYREIWPSPQRRWDMCLAGFGILALTLIGFVDELKRRMGLTHFYVILFVGTLLVWPHVWATDRFILPLLPFLLMYFLKGGRLLLRKVPPVARRRVGLALVVVMTLTNLRLVAKAAPASLRLMGAHATGDRNAGYSADWINFYETAYYASRFTHPDDVFLVRKPGLFYLFAERKCVAYPFTPDQDAIMAVMDENDVSFVVVDAFAWTSTTRKYLVPTIMAHGDKFAVVYATGAPRTLVLRYSGGKSERTN